MGIDGELENLRERFMGGGCHALALVLSERTGWPMTAIWLKRGRRDEIAHVAVLVPGEGDPDDGMREYLDVGGVRGLPEILYDLDYDGRRGSAMRRSTRPWCGV